jgi:hypothetical protein
VMLPRPSKYELAVGWSLPLQAVRWLVVAVVDMRAARGCTRR